jgi:uncharacterized protein YbbC (DUF1343 family)
VNEVQKLYPAPFEWNASHFDRLCGTASIRKAITARTSLERLKPAWEAVSKLFQEVGREYLLYAE